MAQLHLSSLQFIRTDLLPLVHFANDVQNTVPHSGTSAGDGSKNPVCIAVKAPVEVTD